MFAKAMAAGLHSPGSLNALLFRYSFRHRFLNIVCIITKFIRPVKPFVLRNANFTH